MRCAFSNCVVGQTYRLPDIPHCGFTIRSQLWRSMVVFCIFENPYLCINNHHQGLLLIVFLLRRYICIRVQPSASHNPTSFHHMDRHWVCSLSKFIAPYCCCYGNNITINAYKFGTTVFTFWTYGPLLHEKGVMHCFFQKDLYIRHYYNPVCHVKSLLIFKLGLHPCDFVL